MAWGSPLSSLLLILVLLWSSSPFAVIGSGEPEEASCPPPLVTRENRKIIVSTDSGSISVVDIDDKYAGKYHLEFFTLEPQSLLLPLLLHTDMVFYVQTGRGNMSWIDEDKIYELQVESGDIYRIGAGSVVYMLTPPAPTGEKLQVHAIFDTLGSDVSPDACIGPYSNLSDLVRGFDELVLRMGFKVSQEVITGIKSAEKPAPIVPFPAKNGTDSPATWMERFFEVLMGDGRPFGSGSGEQRMKGKIRKFNLLNARPDVENCYGRIIAVSDKVRALKGSVFGVFNVKLMTGSMTGPHWNPLSTDIAVVTHGQGIVQVVLPNTSPEEGKPSNTSSGASKPSNSTSGDDSKRSNSSSAEGACKCPSITFKVGEGDVFLVPRYHAVAHMSFNNDSLIFVGFRTSSRKNSPQLLAGKSSVLQILDREIVALSLGVSNATVGQLLASQEDTTMLGCTSCAEEEEKKIEAKAEKQKKEGEEKKKKEEAESRMEEEEAGRQKEEEGEKRRKQEEKATAQEEEEEKRRQEEARRQEEKRQRQAEEKEGGRKEGEGTQQEGACRVGSESFKLRRVWMV